MQTKILIHQEDWRFYWASWVSDDPNGEWEYDANGECPADIKTERGAVDWAKNEWPGCFVTMVDRTA
jgi:hypothetical protein